MLKEILTISGRPGLFKLVARGNNCLIVESVDSTARRLPVQGTDKVVSLGDISIYTDHGEMSLREVFYGIQEKYGKQTLDVDAHKASADELNGFMSGVVPDYDRDRVYPSHIKKIISWYNILAKAGQDDFSEPESETEDASASKE